MWLKLKQGKMHEFTENCVEVFLSNEFTILRNWWLIDIWVFFWDKHVFNVNDCQMGNKQNMTRFVEYDQLFVV